MEEHIKVLSVNTSDASGGAARAAYRIHGGVRKLGINSYMFVKDKQLTDETVLLLTSFVPVNAFYSLYYYIQHKFKNKIQQYRWSKYPNRRNDYLSDLRSSSIHGAFQKIDFDVLHLHWINSRFLDLKELTKINKPIIWTLHDTWAFTGICHYFYDCEGYKNECGNCPMLNSNNKNDLSNKIWKQKKKIYLNLDIHLVAPSKWIADLASKSSLMHSFPVTIIPNGLNTDLYKPLDKVYLRNENKLKANQKLILFGAVNPMADRRKGFNELKEALIILEKTNRESDIILGIFGTNSSFELEVNIPVVNFGIISSDERLVEIYNLADVMVVPSLAEVFGQTASEAMACGIPVVAFDCTGIKEVVNHKKTGYLATPFRSDDLANGIKWCLENNQNKELSLNARKKVEEEYSMKVVGEKYKRVYEEVLKNSL